MRANEQLEKLIKSVSSRLSRETRSSEGKKTTISTQYIKYYLRRGVIEDLNNYYISEIADMISSSWEFMEKRKLGNHKIRVFNQNSNSEKWQDNSTVIEIINDDMPFLVDSVLALINELGYEIRLVLHPIFAIKRNSKGELEKINKISEAGVDGVTKESLIHIELNAISSDEEITALENHLDAVHLDIRVVVLAWRSMQKRLNKAINDFQSNPPAVPVDELAEAIQFLQWLLDNHFTFLGMREYAFSGGTETGELKAVPESGLGILNDPDVQVLRRGRELVSITPEVREFLMQPAPIIITKANVKATVHRRVHMDYIGIKQFKPDGTLTGELRIVGLFTSAAYTRSPRYIPIVRRKIAHVMDKSGFDPNGHNGKALLNVLENYPRDELFQIGIKSLAEIASGIHQLDERPRPRIFVRRDKFDRFVSIMVYVPRDRYNTNARKRVGDLLAKVYEGIISAFYPAFPDGVLVRVHYIIGRYEGSTPEPDLNKLENEIAEIVRTWDDRLKDTIDNEYKPSDSQKLISRYTDSFSAAYQDTFSPEYALADIEIIEKLADETRLAVDFYYTENDPPWVIRLKIYHLGEPIALSDRLPILENMGLRAVNERSFRINRHDNDLSHTIWLHDIVLRTASGKGADLDTIKDVLEKCFLAVWYGEAENDGYNALTLKQAINWRDIAVLRAYSRYLRQTGISYSQRYMWTTLSKNSNFALLIIKLFYSRFSIIENNKTNANKQKKIIEEIEEALMNVPNLDEDKIIRRFVNVIQATLRTNFFQINDNKDNRPTISFKIRSREIDELPDPKPYAEIFVYSPDVEGIHLRFGQIARGGLRWSDRPEDFRTEVLGLVKAQQVKNAVIVPVGSKGGFVPKKLPVGTTRESIQEEAIRCYKLFISSLLQLTDNLDGNKIIPPRNTVRNDGDDPYLVVAADKGTATFSDIANELSEKHGFWLGDAFASGGSAGYDHKKMGITARGAWEAVKRHFREMDRDIQSDPFTVIGVGDMSGDVFGNGMLLSKHIKLIAAFDHRDIFIDPDPSHEISYKERQRVFKLARSSWRDYDNKLISKGGGVFSRSLKSIDLSKQIQEITGLKVDKASPTELIKALLTSSIDLLWFGGIGTYIRSSTETDENVGDRANDSLRVTAKKLKAKVVGEGANLGMTQRARIEFALAGGRVNNDAIDNSAGVNSSDLEVNIKIALGAAEKSGKLKRDARNKLLASMTDDVASLVLRNNYQQTLSLSISQNRVLHDIGFQIRLMRSLESEGLLDRAVEFLPDDIVIAEREAQGNGLTRPEAAVLMSYSKIVLFDQLLDSNIPDDEYIAEEVSRYFPDKMCKEYANELEKHKLKREIVATMLANSMINRGGATFVSRITDETGASVSEIAQAYVMARDSFSFIELNDKIDNLDNKVLNSSQISLYTSLQNELCSQTIWFLRNIHAKDGIKPTIDHYQKSIKEVEKCLKKSLSDKAISGIEKHKTLLLSQKIPLDLAEKMSSMRYLSRAPDIIMVANKANKSIADISSIFFSLGEKLKVNDIIYRSNTISPADYFERIAINRCLEQVSSLQRDITAQIVAAKLGNGDQWENWSVAHEASISRIEQAINETMIGGKLSLAKLIVAASYIGDLLKH